MIAEFFNLSELNVLFLFAAFEISLYKISFYVQSFEGC